MSSGATDFEALLRQALAPVEPPADLAQRVELTLVSLTELAQEELDAWELSAMRDPDEPGPQGPAARLAQRSLKVAVGLQERLLGEILSIVMVAHAVVAVGINVPEVRFVQLREPRVDLGLAAGQAVLRAG